MKHPNEMSAAAINRELDAIDKKQSVLLDEFIAAGRGNERPTDWQDKTDPLSMKEKALSERRADLMHEVRRRAGPGMYRLPKGFGPMKNPATRKPGTVAAINRQIDAINRRGKNPARTATLVARNPAAKNPVRATVTDRKKQLPDFRYLVQIEGTGGAGDWFSEAAFRLLSRAEEYAHFLAKKHPSASIRVLARD